MHNERRTGEERSNEEGESETIIARRLIEVGQSVARTKGEEGENAIGSKRSPDQRPAAAVPRSMIA